MVNADWVASYIVAAGDGDLAGLHELPSAVGRLTSELGPGEILSLLRDACRELIERGHVQMLSTPAFADRPGRDGYEVVSNEDARAIIQADDAWRAPIEARTRYWMKATDAGKARYISEDEISL